jgi:hypothetical protein
MSTNGSFGGEEDDGSHLGSSSSTSSSREGVGEDKTGRVSEVPDY